MGVWIEISFLIEYSILPKRVTPYVGVWIEIFGVRLGVGSGIVTPYVGVWIEIESIRGGERGLRKSPPMWGCGLKYLMALWMTAWTRSPPMWGCGLKFSCRKSMVCHYCHPLCGGVD